MKLSRSSSVSMGSVASFDDLDNDNVDSDDAEDDLTSDDQTSGNEEPELPFK